MPKPPLNLPKTASPLTGKSLVPRRYRLLSWNVNGVRAILRKGLLEWLAKEKPDVLCLQETKAHTSQLTADVLNPKGYTAYWSSAEKPGYSGVATFTREKPLKVEASCGEKRFDCEGRILRTDYEDFTLFNVYFPNGKMGPHRLEYKMAFYDMFLKMCRSLRKKGTKLVVCGDVNTAHKEIDLARPKENEKISGFLPVERAWMDQFVAEGFVDSFRVFQKEGGHYSWWDMKSGARARNVGWRIDYFYVSDDLRPNLKKAYIMPQVVGSDHCPVGIDLAF